PDRRRHQRHDGRERQQHPHLRSRQTEGFEIGGKEWKRHAEGAEVQQVKPSQRDESRHLGLLHRGNPSRLATSGKWDRICSASAAPSISSSEVSLDTRRASSENGPLVTTTALPKFSPRAVSSAACTSALCTAPASGISRQRTYTRCPVSGVGSSRIRSHRSGRTACETVLNPSSLTSLEVMLPSSGKVSWAMPADSGGKPLAAIVSVGPPRAKSASSKKRAITKTPAKSSDAM